MATPREVSFKSLSDVPVHYDRDPGAYGTRGRPYTFRCTARLRDTLEACMSSLFDEIPYGKPEVITSAGTIGDGDNAHGKGQAFDLDGLFWSDNQLVMDDFFDQKFLYLGINAHLYLYFPQVLNFYYPNHHDHFHVDFNFSRRFRPESNAQNYFLQAALRYVYDEEIGRHGQHGDGVDGVHGPSTQRATADVLKDLGLRGRGGLSTTRVWDEFLTKTRAAAFSRYQSDFEFNALAFSAQLDPVYKIRVDVRAAVRKVTGLTGPNMMGTSINSIYPGSNPLFNWQLDARAIRTELQSIYPDLEYGDDFAAKYFKRTFGDFVSALVNMISRTA